MKIIFLSLFISFPFFGYGNASFFKAVKENNIDAVKQLLSAGIDVNIGDRNRLTALHFARSAEMVKFLKESGANVDIRAKQGITPLHRITYREDIKPSERTVIFQALLDSGADIHAQDEDGNTVVHYASHENLPDIIEISLAEGVNVNVVNKYGETPLFKAWNESSRRVLIKNKADVKARTRSGKTVLHGYNITASIDDYIEAGADVNARDDKGRTPLHYRTVDPEDVKKLIEAGADVNAIDQNGETPLDKASNVEVAELLIRAGGKSGSSFSGIQNKSDRGPADLSSDESNKLDEIYKVDASCEYRFEPMIVIGKNTCTRSMCISQAQCYMSKSNDEIEKPDGSVIMKGSLNWAFRPGVACFTDSSGKCPSALDCAMDEEVLLGGAGDDVLPGMSGQDMLSDFREIVKKHSKGGKAVQ